MAITLTPVLSAYWDQERSWTLAAYEAAGGYQGLRTRSGTGAGRTSSTPSRTPACAAAAGPASPPG